MVTQRVTGQAIDPDDPWAMAQTNGYDVDNFYVRSTDGKGHSENVQAKLSPAMVGELTAMVHSQQLPYRTLQDFIRDACVHRAKYVSELVRSGRINELPIHGMIAAEAKLAQFERNRQRRALGQRIIEETANEVRDLRDAGKKSEAWDLIEEFEQLAMDWSEETVYPKMLGSIEEWRSSLTQQPLRRIH
jgi:hypothetical protein